MAHPLLTLRPACAADAALLLAWRNDAGTRGASHSTRPITPEEHARWLAATLDNPHRQLLVAEEQGVPVGSVRADRDPQGDCHELSWTVAPDARGRGIGARMVGLLVQRLGGAVRAEIKPGNHASMRIAQAAGLHFAGERDGVLHYRAPFGG